MLTMQNTPLRVSRARMQGTKSSPIVLDDPKADYHIPYHRANAAIPTRAAPALATLVAAPPVKGDGVDDPAVVVLVELLDLPLLSVKLAQVRRVVLLVWMTMERLPKKEPTPEAEEM